jgi:hypothetical protein
MTYSPIMVTIILHDVYASSPTKSPRWTVPPRRPFVIGNRVNNKRLGPTFL